MQLTGLHDHTAETPSRTKAVAVISATPGAFGGVAAQDQLKQVLLAVNTHLVVTPAVIVASAHQKFDQQGNLTDEDTKHS